jgi:hypothetical protein
MIQRTKQAILVALFVFPSVVAAQVGYDPAHSPYHDLRRGSGMFFRGGYLTGDRGRVHVGHSNGNTFTGGYELTVMGPLSFQASVTYALTDRFVVDPFKDDSVRRSGPFKDDMLLIEAGLRFNLTGRKTWRNLAPYILAGTGVAVSQGSPADSSGYSFGKKASFTFGGGFRLYPTRRMNLAVEGRAVMWRLRYPPDFRRISSPDGIPILDVDAPDKDWTVHPMLSIGAGWAF